ncbi:MAG: hypothetical protein KIS94_03560 [Chitinophagales bacterium]|nr:hypothetical protein [Chitinophagales bacterium]
MGFKEKLRDTGIEGLQRYVSFTFAVAFLCIVSFTVVNYYGMQRTYRAMHKESVSLVILKQTELLYNNQRDMRLSCNLFFTINPRTPQPTTPTKRTVCRKTKQRKLAQHYTKPAFTTTAQPKPNI